MKEEVVAKKTYCPGIFLEGLKEITKILSMDSRYVNAEIQTWSSGIEARKISMEPSSPVLWFIGDSFTGQRLPSSGM
jgi:hypothetical protein